MRVYILDTEITNRVTRTPSVNRSTQLGSGDLNFEFIDWPDLRAITQFHLDLMDGTRFFTGYIDGYNFTIDNGLVKIVPQIADAGFHLNHIPIQYGRYKGLFGELLDQFIELADATVVAPVQYRCNPVPYPDETFGTVMLSVQERPIEIFCNGTDFLENIITTMCSVVGADFMIDSASEKLIIFHRNYTDGNPIVMNFDKIRSGCVDGKLKGIHDISRSEQQPKFNSILFLGRNGDEAQAIEGMLDNELQNHRTEDLEFVIIPPELRKDLPDLPDGILLAKLIIPVTECSVTGPIITGTNYRYIDFGDVYELPADGHESEAAYIKHTFTISNVTSNSRVGYIITGKRGIDPLIVRVRVNGVQVHQYNSPLDPDPAIPNLFFSNFEIYDLSTNYLGQSVEVEIDVTVTAQAITFGEAIAFTFEPAVSCCTVQHIAGNGDTYSASDGDLITVGDGQTALNGAIARPTSIRRLSNNDLIIQQNQAGVMRKIDGTTGLISTIFGKERTFSFNIRPTFNAPALGVGQLFGDIFGIDIDEDDNIYFVDQDLCYLGRITPDGTLELICDLNEFYNDYTGDTESPFWFAGIEDVTYKNGFIYTTDYNFNLVLKIEVATGVVTILAGDWETFGYAGDGGDALAAEIDSPQGIALDSNNHIYFCDGATSVIRRIDAETNIITTWAGNGPDGDFISIGHKDAIKIANGARMFFTNDYLYFADFQFPCLRRMDLATGQVIRWVGVPDPTLTVDNGDNGPTQLIKSQAFSYNYCRSETEILVCDITNNKIRATAC